MNRKRIRKLLMIQAVVLLGLLIIPLAAQEANTQWSLWLGSHYTGFQDYMYNVAQYDRGVEGFMPEFQLNFMQQKQKNSWGIKGRFYDPKRMNVTLEGRSLNLINARVSYNSFYRQYQRDLMNNLIVRESGNREGTTMGGKMITHEDNYPNTDYGFRRQEIKTDIDFRIPGMSNVRLFANHRSILESGTQQHLQTMHCSSCHVESHPIDLDRKTHSVSAGLEAKFKNFLLTYQANYRQFKSDVGPVQAFYDTAQHPVNGSLVAEFSSREIFSGEYVPIVIPAQTDKFAHNIKAKVRFGKGQLLAQYVNSNTKNKEGDLNLKGNQASLKFAYGLNSKMKVLAKGAYNRFENDPVFIDLPLWRDGRPGGGQNFDWTRYSSLTRTQQKGSLELIYQPKVKYRLSLLAGYDGITRDDYPYKGADDKTTKLRLQTNVRYRPSLNFMMKVKLYYDKIDNPFSPYHTMFERSARANPLTPLPDNSLIYYFQRDELRYGDITNLPTQVQGMNLDFSYRLAEGIRLTAGVRAQIGTNNDAPELAFKQKSYQPKLGFSYLAGDKFNLFGSYSYLYRTQNGIAAVTMMDG